MSEAPRKRIDPLALAVHGGLIAVVIGVVVFLAWQISSRPKAPEPAAERGIADLLGDARKWIDEQRPRPAPPKPKPQPPVSRPAPVAKTSPPPPAEKPAAALRIDDLRPAKEKRDYDSGEGFFVHGDDDFIPDRLTVLRQRLAAKGVSAAGVQVTKLMSVSVRTSPAQEAAWRIPGMSRYPYWAICEVGIVVDGRRAQARAIEGFSDQAELKGGHDRALLSAIDQAIRVLPQATASPARTYAGRPEAGHVWRYSVAVEPPLWRDATLTYRTVMQRGELGVDTVFRHAGGQMSFNLGTFARSHPSHANTRFPGFFFHPAYLVQPLEVGQRFAWDWPWQLPGGKVRAGRVKRYTGELKAWEDMAIAGGVHPAARIETTLSYVDEGRVQASVRETIWYMPAARQVARVVREGRSPDEGATRIVAQLVEFR